MYALSMVRIHNATSIQLFIQRVTLSIHRIFFPCSYHFLLLHFQRHFGSSNKSSFARMLSHRYRIYGRFFRICPSIDSMDSLHQDALKINGFHFNWVYWFYWYYLQKSKLYVNQNSCVPSCLSFLLLAK